MIKNEDDPNGVLELPPVCPEVDARAAGAAQPGRLVPIKLDVPNDETVKILEVLLEEARTGELQQVMAAVLYRETYTATRLSSGLTLAQACYGMRRLQLRLDDLMRVKESEG